MSLEDHPVGSIDPLVPLGTASPLVEAAQRLLDRPTDALGEIDLSSVVVVTSGRRAGRQVLLELDEAASRLGRRVTPPVTTTLPELDAALGVPRPAVADATTTLAAIEAAIVAAMQASGGVTGDDIVDSHRWLPLEADPLEPDHMERHGLARRLHDADRTIRAADRTWAEVAAVALDLKGDDQRYLGVAALLADARTRLAEVGLVDRDDAVAAVVEALSRGARTAVTEIVLIGVVDISPRDRRLLAAAVAAGVRVRPFVIADEADLDRFDPHGGVGRDAWNDSPPVVPVESIRLEAQPIDTATALGDWLAERQAEAGGTLDPDAVAIVLADEAMGETVRRELLARGLAVHVGAGRAATASGVARTLERLADWFDSPDSTTLGGLLADPVIGAAVEASRVLEPTHRESDGPTPGASSDWAAWAAEQMPRTIEPGWLGPEDEHAPPAVQRRRARLQATEVAIRSLLGDDADAAPIGEQIAHVLGLLARIDATVLADASWSEASLRAVRKAAEPLMSIPPSLQPRLDRRTAVARLIEALRTETMPDPGDADAVETIGWLDAPFDPAARIAIVGLHDAAVPGRHDDPWLPQTLRARLGLDEADRRLARDAWVMSTLLGRDPSLRVIVPRRDGGGEDLLPSRLLFGDRGEALAHRVRRLFDSVPPRTRRPASTTSFARMRPVEAPAREDRAALLRPKMSVTEFRSYLQSPYRYWLRHILGLDVATPVGSELDARFFGIVLHDAVEFFGGRELERLSEGRAPLIDAGAIHDELVQGLQRSLSGRTAGAPGAGLRLQTRIIERRLRQVAEVQAARTLDGWRIHAVEWRIDRELDVPDGPSQRISGRIDRIDRHDEHGWMLLDFKTSDSNKSPDAAHLKRDTWIDLQLPLYRWAASFETDAPDLADIRSGYFLAGSALDRIGVHPSKKIDPMFEEAIDTAREVVHSIRQGYFDGVGDTPPYADDPVALLMRTTALAGEVDE